jgi:hypothetical protein
MSEKDLFNLPMERIEAMIAKTRATNEQLRAQQDPKKAEKVRELLLLMKEQTELKKGLSPSTSTSAPAPTASKVKAVSGGTVAQSIATATGGTMVNRRAAHFQQRLEKPTSNVGDVRTAINSFMSNNAAALSGKRVRVNLYFEGMQFVPYTSGEFTVAELLKMKNTALEETIDRWSEQQENYEDGRRWKVSRVEVIAYN